MIADLSDDALVARGRRVLALERDAIAEADRRLGPAFADAVRVIARATGRVIVAGVGKSGLIGRKIAATLTSTGTPATFLHPVDSVHGDLGLVGPNDVAILISKSGETSELLTLLAPLRRLGVRLIALTGDPASTLTRHVDVTLDGWVREEACPHDLAPTTSTTVALALGDALAVTLLEVKGFKREDFARLHPGGTLGRRLITTVRDVMVADDLPLATAATPVRDAVVALAAKRGIVAVTDGDARLEGVFTAGDLARLMREGDAAFDRRLGDVMTRTPRHATADELGSAVVYRMERFGIVAMPVLDGDGRVVGIVHLHDLMRAGAA